MVGWASRSRQSRCGVVVHVNRIIACALLLALCGCAGNKPLGGSPAIEIVDASMLPPPQPISGRGESAYLIAPTDKLKVTVLNLPELNQDEILVDSGGKISIPLAGTIDAGGHTAQEVASEIAARLRAAYVRNPQVTVNLVEATSQVITVDGEVVQPGLYPVVGQMSLMRAVAVAKGVDEHAKLDDVVVFRTVAGQKMAALYNLNAIRRGAYEDPAIYASDIVIVGESKARRLFDAILQAAPLLTTPLIVLLQNGNN